ncbi:MAG TPA: SDR family oxidoreductase [Terracidiphilus sp.]|jgi:putative NADH-flavin reductase
MAAAAKTSMRLFILGATGGIGLELVAQALERGHQVTVFVRTPQKLGGLRESVTVIQGDVLNPEPLGIALAGQDAVLSTIGPPGLGRSTITSDAARTTVTAMKATRTRRIVIVGVGMLFDDSGLLGRLLRSTFLRNIADDSAEMERIVKATSLDWTIVRPPRLTNGPRTEQYGIADDHLPRGAGGAATIRRADVAHFLLDEVERPGHLQRVVGIAYT